MPTNIRHKILLAEPGTGLCSGQAIISDCFEIERADFAAYADKHQVRSPEGYAIVDKYASIHAWQLQDVTRLGRDLGLNTSLPLQMRPKPTPPEEPQDSL